MDPSCTTGQTAEDHRPGQNGMEIGMEWELRLDDVFLTD